MEKNQITKASWTYDYCVEVPLRGDTLILRDITGNDLEFLDCFLDIEEDDSEQNRLEFVEIVTIIQYLVCNNVEIKRLWSRDVTKIWRLVAENILCRYMDKRAFLKLAGVLQNGRFITTLENIPMAKLILMADVYKEIVEEQSKEQ